MIWPRHIVAAALRDTPAAQRLDAFRKHLRRRARMEKRFPDLKMDPRPAADGLTMRIAEHRKELRGLRGR